MSSYANMAEKRLQTRIAAEMQTDAHIGKELSPEYYDIAVKALGGGEEGAKKMHDEVTRQLTALMESGAARLRDGDGFIISGQIDWTKAGLNHSQVSSLNAARELHGINEALLPAKKLLGNYFSEAVIRLGSATNVAKTMHATIEGLRNDGISLRNKADNSTKLSALTSALDKFISPESVQARLSELAPALEQEKPQSSFANKYGNRGGEQTMQR